MKIGRVYFQPYSSLLKQFNNKKLNADSKLGGEYKLRKLEQVSYLTSTSICISLKLNSLPTVKTKKKPGKLTRITIRFGQ